MTNLPSVPYQDGIRKARTEVFAGYDHNIGAGDGTIWDEKNMTSDYYPVMGTRAPRYSVTTLAKPYGLYALDGLWWVDGSSLYHDGTLVTSVTEGEKQFAAMGMRLLIWPDKIVVDAGANPVTVKSLGATVTAACTIKDGTYAGEEAEKNTIKCTGRDWSLSFKVGDAIHITGTGIDETPIIREIDGDELRFYENTFETTGSYSLTLKREVPDLDFICVNENRCWGCKGDTIYASKLGDPTNWNVFDGVSTDSYAVDAGSDGEFTACCSYLGYPVFFKEEHIYKVYGSRPSNYQLMGSATMGVKEGSHKTLAIAGETLYYLSRSGIVAYAGGVPENISRAFGTDRYSGGAGGSDGLKYHVVMQLAGSSPAEYEHFVWDTRRAMWHREDTVEAVQFAFSGGELWMLGADKKLWGLGLAEAPEGAAEETNMKSYVETNDFVENDPNRKGTAKIQIRGELDAGATLVVRIKFDSGRAGSPSDSKGSWETVSNLSATVKRSWYLPIIPRRSDHFRLRFEGVGEWRIFSLVRENYSGSEI
jgi:hypothetical protein